MNTGKLDAREVARPGGLGESMTNGLMQAMRAYLQNQDNQRQGNREMARDARQGRMAQLNQAMTNAERYGVGPTSERSGWMTTDDDGQIQAALEAHRRAKDAEGQRVTLLQDSAAVTRMRALADLADRWDQRKRAVAKDIMSGVGTIEDARRVGIDDDAAAHLYELGAKQRQAAEKDRLTRESSGRARAERDQAAEDRASEWHQRRMQATPGGAKPKGPPAKTPTSQADLDRVYQNAQRKMQGLAPLPDPVKPAPGSQSAADLWGELEGLLQLQQRGEADAGAEMPPASIPRAAPAAPAPPARRGRDPRMRAALEDWSRREGASIASAVRATSARRASMPA